MKLFLYALLALTVGLVPMAQAALPTNGTTVWEVRPSTGNDANGGCYISGSSGTDFSQQGSPQKAFTDLTVGATTTQATSALNPFASTDVGNCIHIVSGSGCTTGWFYVVSVATTTATLDRAAGSAASVCTANEGGALQTLAQLNTNGVQSQLAWVKAEATITTSTRLFLNYTSSPNTGQTTQLAGYASTRGDGGQVTIKATAEMPFDDYMLQINENLGGMRLQNFIFDCNSQTNSKGFALASNSGPSWAQNILAKNCTKAGIGAPENTTETQGCFRCTVTATSGDGAFTNTSGTAFYCVDCVAYTNSTSGFVTGSGLVCIRCISANNSGASSDGFQIVQGGTSAWWLAICDNCIAYKNGRDGYRLSIQSNLNITNSVAYGNTGVGLDVTNATIPLNGYLLNWNALGANTGGARTGNSAGANDVTLGSDPFVSGSTNNFALSAGATSLMGAGFPGALAVGGTGFLDIGALQHQPSSGGGTFGSPIQ